MFMESIKKKC